jgi:hypothetical protein
MASPPTQFYAAPSSRAAGDDFVDLLEINQIRQQSRHCGVELGVREALSKRC